MTLANLLSSLATGVFFALMFWVLNNVNEAILFNVVAFVLGAIAESFRRWLVGGAS